VFTDKPFPTRQADEAAICSNYDVLYHNNNNNNNNNGQEFEIVPSLDTFLALNYAQKQS
jgi:hypothetical protein